jgi:cell division protein FtsN
MNEANNDQNKISHEHCICTSMRGLFIPNRQLSFIVATSILLLFFAFIGGYFWGTRQATDQFISQLDQDSLADQIFTSLCAPDEYPDTAADNLQEEETDQPSEETQETLVAPEQMSSELPAHSAATVQDNIPTQAPVIAEQQKIEQIEPAEKQYYAQLIGFGTKQAAQQFVHRLEKKGISVAIKTRYSKTAKERQIAWYQVITKPYANKQELASLVSRIKKEEKLKGVVVVPC